MGSTTLSRALGRMWAFLLAEFAFWIGWSSKAASVTLKPLPPMRTAWPAQFPCAFLTSSPLLSPGPKGCLNALPLPCTSRDVLKRKLPQPGIAAIGTESSRTHQRASYCPSALRRLWQTGTYRLASAEGPRSTACRWETIGRPDIAPDVVDYGRSPCAFSRIPLPYSYGEGQGYFRRHGEWPGWFSAFPSRPAGWSCSRSKAGDFERAGQMLVDDECYPRDMEAFQRELLHLDDRFLQIAKETNAEILHSLGMLWRQRRLEQQHGEEQQYTSGGRASTQTPLYGSTDQVLFGRKSNMAFRARAYKTAYEILHRARIPLYNIAEVLLLLREGGLLLRGEEASLVKRDAFRSAVLQKIHLVMSRGVSELIKKSRSFLRERAVQDLSRLPGVTKRTAAELFDEHFIDSPQALRDRLVLLRRTLTSKAGTIPNRKTSATPSGGDESWSLGALPTPDSAALAKLFPTELSRACVIHADAFAAPVDTAEFDEWQQQLLLVQDGLRKAKDLVPELPLAGTDDQEATFASQDFPTKFHALPVISLGGGIFRSANNKLTSLSLQISFLPSWTEEGHLPPALDHAVCCGGQGAGPEENSWLMRQWEHVSLAYRTLRHQLHRSVVEALRQRNLLAEVISENMRTKTTHAASRLPWRQETYRLLAISSVSPRAFPFATLAARCSASAYRRLQDRTRKRWGWELTPRGLTISALKSSARSVAADEDETGTSAPIHQVATGPASEEDLSTSTSKGDDLSCALGEQVSWVFDEQGVLRLLKEPLSMQDRVGKALVGD